VAARLPSRPIDITMAMRVEKRSGGNQRVTTTMVPISMTPKPAPISTRAGEQHRPARRQREDGAASRGEDQHARPRLRRGPKWSNRKPQGICMAAKPKKNAPVSAPSAFRPDRKIAHQVEPDGDVGGAEEMAGDIGGGQCRDDDQAPAVGERAPRGGRHRWGVVPLLVEICG